MEEDLFEKFIMEIEGQTPAGLEYGLGHYPHLLNLKDARRYAEAKLELDTMRKETYLRQTMSPEQAAQIPPDVDEARDYDVDEMEQREILTTGVSDYTEFIGATQLSQMIKPAQGRFYRGQHKWK